ncbi:MAG: hypothetical protein K8Q92_07525 [Methylophilales bacterium]|nr:hypothetical protein [Methylophilales bacterium]
MNSDLIKLPLTKTLAIVVSLAFFMLLTRGSHVLTAVALPDASLALFLLGGLMLKRANWFVALVALATAIDFGAASIDSLYAFCITNGYWGMFPTYTVMWLGGRWLAKQYDAFSALPYAVVGLVSTSVAFVISTQTYYLFSGRFPNTGVLETMQYGWEYLPSYLGFTAMYLGLAWMVTHGLRRVNVMRSATA